MKFTVKYFEKMFYNDDSKEAYLEACKWLATNVISKVEVRDSLVQITKLPQEKSDLPTFKLELFAQLDDTEERSRFCERCQEFHKLFYINQQFNCDKCNMTAYNENMKTRLITKKGLRKGQLRKIVEESEE
jgi:uncharacterized paraquat-inducible protein A